MINQNKLRNTTLIILASITFFPFYTDSELLAAEKKTESIVMPAEIEEVPFTDVHFTDKFWLPRMDINRTVSIPSAFYQCEINGRFDNFAIAGKLKEGEHKGDFPFDDTDPYKVIEGASYSLAVKYDPKLDLYLDSVIALIAAAQEPDGYLTTCVTNKCYRLSGWWGRSKWEKINSHELYNCGHLYEAAVAHFKATGKRSFLDVAIKNANLICKFFGPGEGQKHVPSGHPIVEMALVKLYKVTKDDNYLKLARYFVDETGRGTDGHRLNKYSQDHMPIMQQKEIVGHAVRAGYLFSGVTDVAAMQKDMALMASVKKVWDNMTGRKLYITGGIGSRSQGEGFGPDYELNNFNDYCETCASIANIYWNQRLFLATGESKYIDVLERTLYNALIAGVSLSGDKFFYDNPLATNGCHERAPWFGCACCPGNLTRFAASVPGYVYAIKNKDLYVNLFAEGNSIVKVGGNNVELLQKTEYPWSGDVEITVNPEKNDSFNLLVRMPGWVKNQPVPTDLYKYVDGAKPVMEVTVNGKKLKKEVRNGYLLIYRKWNSGDKISIHMDMPVRRVQANSLVNYDKGLLCMERGPVVYALESIDQENEYLFDLVIPRNSKILYHYENGLLNGVIVLEGNCLKVIKDSKTGKITENPAKFKAIPYCTWNNRGVGQMVVWTPEKKEYAILKPESTIASRASIVNGSGVNDQFEPKSSADVNSPYHYWWLKNGTEEEIGYKLKQVEKVSGVEIYWLAFEHYDVIYKAPESWKLFYKSGDDWKEVEATTEYGTAIDKYNILTFKTIETNELKIKVQLQRPKTSNNTKEKGPQNMDIGRHGFSGGVIEWKVNP